MPRFAAQATIISPQKLTERAETDLFAHSLARARNEILRLFDDPDLGAGAITMHALPRTFSSLTLPSTLTGGMKNLPTVKGVDVGSIVKLLASMGQYFTWRLESALAFNPAIKAEDGHPAAPPRMRAFASIRWAWYVGTSAEVERDVWDQYDVHALAVALAARLMEVKS